jgi:uncharacterized membrane protein (DUF441 family)
MEYFTFIWVASAAILIFLAIYFTVLAGKIMEQKRRLNIFWGLVILTIGPLALIIAVKMKPKIN